MGQQVDNYYKYMGQQAGDHDNTCGNKWAIMEINGATGGQFIPIHGATSGQS